MSDTASLVRSEEPQSCEEIALAVDSSKRHPVTDTESVHYDVCVVHHSTDYKWVSAALLRLQAAPHHLRCCTVSQELDSAATRCTIRLSRCIVVTLSEAFATKNVWFPLAETLAANHESTRCIVGVLLDDCSVPSGIATETIIDSRSPGFWENLVRALIVDNLPYSQSLYTIQSLSSQCSGSAGFSNGQILSTSCTTVQGFCRASLLFDYEELPDTLTVPDIELRRQEYSQLMRMVSHDVADRQLSWLFTSLPSIILMAVFVSWCVAFILTIFLFPDDAPSTLPVRLCVFSLPALLLVLGCIVRWKKLQKLKQKLLVSIFSESIQANKLLHEKAKPLIITAAKTANDVFQIYFMYFNRSECIERINMFLTHCANEDVIRLSKLTDVYTVNSGYLNGSPLGARLAVMMSSVYAVKLILKCIPHSLERRHMRQRQCLCQFVEEFIATYLAYLHNSDSNTIEVLRSIFHRYLHCHLDVSTYLIQTLGMSLVADG